VDEVVCRAAVEEGRQTVSADVDRDHHRVLGANAGDGVEGDNRVRLLSRLGASTPGRSVILAIGRVVGHLQVEEALALVATYVGLVAVVAEALAAAFHHLSRSQTAERFGRRRR